MKTKTDAEKIAAFYKANPALKPSSQKGVFRDTGEEFLHHRQGEYKMILLGRKRRVR